ncbi:MAG: hypothetical protein ABMA25_06095 [Ilumatobacteraceae bacterium]
MTVRAVHDTVEPIANVSPQHCICQLEIHTRRNVTQPLLHGAASTGTADHGTVVSDGAPG